MAIFAEALDEFFQVRVSGVQDKVLAGVRTRSVDGLRPAEQLAAIRRRVEQLVVREDAIFLGRLVPALADAGVRLSDWSALDDDDRSYLVDVFHRQIFPVLTPLAVDPGHPFPYISNLSLNLLVEVRDPATAEARIARVKVPPVLDRFVVMPDNERFVPLEQVIAAHLDTLFPGMTIGEHDPFRVTRNADLAARGGRGGRPARGGRDGVTSQAVRKRRPPRDHVGREPRAPGPAGPRPSSMCRWTASTRSTPPSISPACGPSYASTGSGHSTPRPVTPMTPPYLATAGNEPTDLFSVLRERSLRARPPSVRPRSPRRSEGLRRTGGRRPRGAGDQADALPDVLGHSPSSAPLIKACRASGKQVAALVEVKARFTTSRPTSDGPGRLEEAGVHVVYGLVGLKTHSKTVLVLRREDDGIRRYCHVGTGNYNSRTASIYEDLGLLTADRDIGADVGDLFNYLTGFSRQSDYNEILVSPVTLRRKVLEMIEQQEQAGERGRIVLKVNGLTDPEMIDALYRASRAGVPIDLSVRGLCSASAPGCRSCRRRSRCARSSGSSSKTRASTGSAAPRTTRRTEPISRGRGTTSRSASSSARRTSWNGTLDRRIEVLTPRPRPRSCRRACAEHPRPRLHRRRERVDAGLRSALRGGCRARRASTPSDA